MKSGLLLPCGAIALLFCQACGGDKPAAPSPVPAAPVQPAAPVPAAQAQEPGKRPAAPVRVDYEMAKRLFGNDPSAPAVDNPSTPEKVALGNALYHEKHLSKNGNLSCASCHDLSNYGVDNKPTSPGSDGKNGERNTPTTYNAFRQFKQFWDGRAETIEEQATGPVFNPVEHGLADEAQLVAKIKEKPELVEGFKKAFPGAAEPVTAANFRNAVGAFERTLVTRSRWDDYLDGNKKALTAEEVIGLDQFIKVGCVTCHVNRTLGGHMFQKTGAVKPYTSHDTGREQVTKAEADKFMFKVPSLLNVEKTGPYFHDGKVSTLEEVVTIMADIQLQVTLKKEQVDSIVAFLKALTGPLPAEFAAKK